MDDLRGLLQRPALQFLAELCASSVLGMKAVMHVESLELYEEACCT